MSIRDDKVFSTNSPTLARAPFKHYSVREEGMVFDPCRKDLAQLLQHVDNICFPPKTTLYHEHDQGKHVFTLRQGLVKLVCYLPDGTQRIVRLLHAGDSGGMECLVAPAYEHTAIAINNVRAYRVPVSSFDKLIEAGPWFYQLLIDHWHHSLQQADNCIVRLSTGPVRSRIAHLMSLLATPTTGERDVTVKLLSTQDMAAMLGVTLESISRTIADLKRKGILRKVRGNVYRYDAATLDRITRV